MVSTYMQICFVCGKKHKRIFHKKTKNHFLYRLRPQSVKKLKFFIPVRSITDIIKNFLLQNFPIPSGLSILVLKSGIKIDFFIPVIEVI